MKFTHLHVHSHYSLLDGLPKIDDLLAYVKNNQMDSVALTDHGNMYGAVEFYKKAKKEGVKPIIGCEVYLAFESMLEKRANIDNKIFHLILLAKNETGYRNLVKLVSKAQLEGFYYKPRVDETLLEQHAEGLIALSACIQGRIPRLALSNKPEEAAGLAKKYQKIFGKDNFFLEIQNHPNLKGQKEANQFLIDFSKKLDIPLVLTNDCHYLNKDDSSAQDILMLINTGAKPDDPERLTMRDNDFSMTKPQEALDFCKELGVESAFENTQRIAAACSFEFELGKTKLPKFKTPEQQSPDQYIRELCLKGLEKKKAGLDLKQAQERLLYELKIIEATGFASYFLIVQDFVNWAKENRIVVGPGRGSAGGSLVAYLLNITEVNPLQHELLFERFLNPERISMPDIDLDFTDRRRDEVINYVSEKYGQDHVAQIITFGTMAARAVIRDVGRALHYEYNYCDKVAKMIPFGFDLEKTLDQVAEFRQLYRTDQKAKELIDFAKKLEGVARHASTHACGVVISANPLDESVPLQYPTQTDKTVVTQYEMHSIEDLGLLKMDFLGLKNLTIIEDTLARIYKVQNKSIDLSAIDFQDKKTLKLFQEAKTTSVFQLESNGMKRYLKDLKPNSFDDIVSMIALYRPGPMELIPEYILRKNNRKPVEYIHPALEQILKPTYGLPVFQEQIMKIAQTLAGFSLSEADVLRKAIGKKIRELLMEQKEKFINGCIKNNVSKEIASQVFAWIEPHASYSFNKSHAVAYGIIAFKTAFLKAHYPVEFMASALTSEQNDIERVAFLIEECKEMGLEVLAPDINESFHNFSVIPKENKIRFGLKAIKNVGGNIVSTIIEERKQNGPYKSFSDFALRIDTKDFNKKSLEALIKAGCFDRFEERNKLLENLEAILSFNREIRKNKESAQESLFGFDNSENLALNLREAPPAKEEEKLRWEKELLGLFISSHPLKRFAQILERKTAPLKSLKQDSFQRNVVVGGLVASVKKILTKRGQSMLFVKLEDLTDTAEVVVFPSLLEAKPDLFEENKIIFVAGRKDMRDGEPKIIANQAEEIVES